MTIQFGSRLSQFKVLSPIKRANRNESLEQTLLIIYGEEQELHTVLLLLLLVYMRISIWAITVLQWTEPRSLHSVLLSLSQEQEEMHNPERVMTYIYTHPWICIVPESICSWLHSLRGRTASVYPLQSFRNGTIALFHWQNSQPTLSYFFASPVSIT